MNLQQTAKLLLVALCSVVISEGAPVASDKLHFKKAGKGVCEWGCNSNIDKRLEMCEAVCHLDSQNFNNVYENETRCQEVCASTYVRCLHECGNTVNTKKAPT